MHAELPRRPVVGLADSDGVVCGIVIHRRVGTPSIDAIPTRRIRSAKHACVCRIGIINGVHIGGRNPAVAPDGSVIVRGGVFTRRVVADSAGSPRIENGGDLGRSQRAGGEAQLVDGTGKGTAGTGRRMGGVDGRADGGGFAHRSAGTAPRHRLEQAAIHVEGQLSARERRRHMVPGIGGHGRVHKIERKHVSES